MKITIYYNALFGVPEQFQQGYNKTVVQSWTAVLSTYTTRIGP